MLHLLLSSVFISLIYGQQCPSSEYVVCATENGLCLIPDRVNEGYMSYGANGRWNLIPFTNSHTDGTDLNIFCDNDFGDIIPGTKKFCCFIAADTGFTEDAYRNTKIEGTGGWRFNNDHISWAMRYGKDDRFTYRVVQGRAEAWCDNDYMGDSAKGIGKECNLNEEHPESLPIATSSDWTFCAVEGNDCIGLDTASAQWVRYGDNNHFYTRLVISANDGRIPCNNDFFEDPIRGVRKFCERAPAQVTFLGLIGQWTKLQTCLGCASNEFTKSVGITELEETEITDTFESSLSVTVSAGFEFPTGSSGGVEVTGSVSESVSNRMLSSFSQTVTEEAKFVCEKDSLFQWTIGAQVNNGINSQSFSVRGEDLACLENPFEPLCPPGFCADDECQECLSSFTNPVQSRSIIITDDPINEERE